MVKLLFFLVLVVLVVVQGQQIQKQRLRFKISGKDLPDKDNIGVTDPYVEIYYTENGGTKETKFGRSETITDSINPLWGTIFEFDYDRSKAQRWHLKVKDHDNAREDDTVGKAWVIVDDYVDRGQKYTSNLHKKGTVTLETVDPVVVPQAQVIQPAVIQPGAPILIQPAVQPAVIVQQQNSPQRLRIQLSARGLPDTDLIGTIDPYVKAYYTDDSTKSEQPFGRTAPINDQENPNFTDILEFDYVPGKNQRWHFLVLDDDENRKDDSAGDVFLDVQEFVNNGQNSVLKLNKGQLFVKKA